MEQFRTSVSLVFWSADADAAQSEIDSIAAALPEEARGSMLANIEFIAAGKPEPPPEPEEPAE